MAKRNPEGHLEYRPVADRLNASLVAAVTKSPPEQHQTPDRSKRRDRGGFEREKRVLMTRDEELQLNELIARLGSTLDVKLSASHVIRASLSLLHRRETEIMTAAREQPVPHRPSNGNPIAMAQFEDAIADLLLRGLRRG